MLALCEVLLEKVDALLGGVVHGLLVLLGAPVAAERPAVDLIDVS